MDEHDLIRKLGRFLDKIYQYVSEAFEPDITTDWQCGRCGYARSLYHLWLHCVYHGG